MSIADTDLVEVLRGGVSYKATGTQINDYLEPSGYEVTNSIDFSKGTGSMNWGNNVYRDTYTAARGYSKRQQRNVVISFWIKPSPSTAVTETMMYTDSFDTDDTEISIKNTGVLDMKMGGDAFKTNDGYLKLNEWNHVFIRWSNYGVPPGVSLSAAQRLERIDCAINGVTLTLADLSSSSSLPTFDIRGNTPPYSSNIPLYWCLQSDDDKETDKVKQTVLGGGKKAEIINTKAFKGKLAEFIILNLPDNFVNTTVSSFPSMPTVNDFAEFNSAGKWIPKDPRESTKIKFKDADPTKSPVAYYLEFKDASKLWASPETTFQLQNTVTNGVTNGVTSAYQSTDTPTST